MTLSIAEQTSGGAVLNDLVWTLILEELYEVEQQSFLSLCRVSRQLYILGTPLLHRSIFFKFETQGRPSTLLRRLLNPSTFLVNFIRHLSFATEYEVPDAKNADLLRSLILRTSRLETMTWRGTFDIPVAILDALHSACPSAELIVRAYLSPAAWPDDAQQPAGISSAALRDLGARIPDAADEQQAGRRWVHGMLRGCPNLQTLLLAPEYGAHGPSDEYPSLFDSLPAPARGVKLPKLRELYRPAYALSRRDVEAWGLMGGFSELLRLKLDGCDYLEEFAGTAPKLRSLEIIDIWVGASGYKALQAALEKFEALEELKLRGDDDQFPFEAVTSLSKTLVSLNVHTPEPFGPMRRRDILIEDLQRLRRSCPNLKKLGIDINRSGSWPYELFKELAQFPSLEHLTLHMEHIRGISEVPPLIDPESCAEIASYMLSHAPVSARTRLRTLVIYRGGMLKWGGEYPDESVEAQLPYNYTYTCTIDPSASARDVAQGIGITVQHPSSGQLVSDRNRKTMDPTTYLDRGCEVDFEGLDSDGLEFFRAYILREMAPLTAKNGREEGKKQPPKCDDEPLKLTGRMEEVKEVLDRQSREALAGCKAKLERHIAKKGRNERMMKKFGETDTLYDMLRSGVAF